MHFEVLFIYEIQNILDKYDNLIISPPFTFPNNGDIRLKSKKHKSIKAEFIFHLVFNEITLLI